ncbi:hypothetical protein LX36DRAFT_236127 [Colletotrichum falcatum]|nr:hypothetical protein LX36DRAFT_236127 [Colletotrichum falcatum]
MLLNSNGYEKPRTRAAFLQHLVLLVTSSIYQTRKSAKHRAANNNRTNAIWEFGPDQDTSPYLLAHHPERARGNQHNPPSPFAHFPPHLELRWSRRWHYWLPLHYLPAPVPVILLLPARSPRRSTGGPVAIPTHRSVSATSRLYPESHERSRAHSLKRSQLPCSRYAKRVRVGSRQERRIVRRKHPPLPLFHSAVSETSLVSGCRCHACQGFHRRHVRPPT